MPPMEELTLSQLLPIFGAYLVAGFVKGTTGLGFSTTALPFLVLVFGLEASLPLVIAPSVTSNLIVMRSAGHVREMLARFWPLCAGAGPGLLIGLTLLTTLSPTHATTGLGVVLMMYCTFALARPNLHLPMRLARPFFVPVGMANGIFNGLTGSQVMPVVPFLMALHLTPDRFVQASNIFFTTSSVLMAIGLATIGFFPPVTAAVSVAGLLPVFLGVRMGTGVRGLLSARAFRTAVLLVLTVAGASLITQAWSF